MKVKDVCKWISLKPAAVSPETPIEKVIEKVVEDPTTRSVYVVANGKLMGVIPISHLMRITAFKFSGILPEHDELKKHIKSISANTAADVMLPPLQVHLEDALEDALKLMIDNNVQELPIVDNAGNIIGDLNSLEILMGFWEMKKDGV